MMSSSSNYNHYHTPIASHPSSAFYNYSDSNYSEPNKPSILKRQSGLGSFGQNILGTAVPNFNVERSHSHAINKPINYNRADNDYSGDNIQKNWSSKHQITPQPSTYLQKNSEVVDRMITYKNPNRNYLQTLEPEKKNDWITRLNSGNKGFKNDELNETFTSLKAKRNVSDYQNVNLARPIYSRERKQPDWETGISSGFTIMGLENLGNTWYFNVILQWLFHLKIFNKIFLDDSYKRMLNNSQKSEMCGAFAELIKKTLEPWTSSSRPSKSKMIWKKGIQDYVSTKYFKRELWINYPDFKGNEQHDAHEFCTSLLDIMSKELNRIKTQPKYTEIKNKPSDSIEKQAQRWMDYYKEREDSYITDCFQGQNMVEIKWSKWQNTTYSFDTMMFLHLEITGKTRWTMDQLIQNISNSEIIDDYKWSKWRKETKHTKTNYMYAAPRILIVHLKRFEIGMYNASKITTTVELDNELKIPLKSGKDAWYNLLSIIHHSGSLNSGHYYWEIKDEFPQGGKKWHLFNDEMVSSTHVNANSKTGYIMFYELK
jgi:ubiquitin C-terminal hydrolase